jgi:hypothetical protein
MRSPQCICGRGGNNDSGRRWGTVRGPFCCDEHGRTGRVRTRRVGEGDPRGVRFIRDCCRRPRDGVCRRGDARSPRESCSVGTSVADRDQPRTAWCGLGDRTEHRARFPDDHPISLLSDAVGLAAFATTGAIVATDTGVSAFGVVAVATINAAGGGAFADILLDRSPFILFDDFYASCAVLGGSAYWLVVTAGGAGSTAAGVCAAVTVGIRLAAINYGWGLPNAQILGLARQGDDDNR